MRPSQAHDGDVRPPRRFGSEPPTRKTAAPSGGVRRPRNWLPVNRRSRSGNTTRQRFCRAGSTYPGGLAALRQRRALEPRGCSTETGMMRSSTPTSTGSIHAKSPRARESERSRPRPPRKSTSAPCGAYSVAHWENYYRGGALASCPMGQPAPATRSRCAKCGWPSSAACRRLPRFSTRHRQRCHRALREGSSPGCWPPLRDPRHRPRPIHPVRDVRDGAALFTGIRFHPGVPTERLPFCPQHSFQ